MKQRRALTVTAIALTVAVLLSACGGDSDEASDASASPTASATSTATAAAWVTLPASDLPKLDGLTYTVGAVSDADALAAVRGATADPAAVYGYLGRAITSGTKQVGGVQITRVREPIPTANRDKVAAATLQEFAQKAPTAAKLAGRKVQEVDKARGTTVGAVLWIDGKDIVILYADGLKEARRLSTEFIEASQ